jgi:hypothetical protein
MHRDKIRILADALRMAEGRFYDLSVIISETTKMNRDWGYRDSGFLQKSADRCRDALKLANQDPFPR